MGSAKKKSSAEEEASPDLVAKFITLFLVGSNASLDWVVERVRAYVETHPNATLEELGQKAELWLREKVDQTTIANGIREAAAALAGLVMTGKSHLGRHDESALA